eukprot:scaffold161580_cov54-Cyclotella_meneghiniana.AAC.6
MNAAEAIVHNQMAGQLLLHADQHAQHATSATSITVTGSPGRYTFGCTQQIPTNVGLVVARNYFAETFGEDGQTPEAVQTTVSNNLRLYHCVYQRSEKCAYLTC